MHVILLVTFLRDLVTPPLSHGQPPWELIAPHLHGMNSGEHIGFTVIARNPSRKEDTISRNVLKKPLVNVNMFESRWSLPAKFIGGSFWSRCAHGSLSYPGETPVRKTGIPKIHLQLQQLLRALLRWKTRQLFHVFVIMMRASELNRS